MSEHTDTQPTPQATTFITRIGRLFKRSNRVDQVLIDAPGHGAGNSEGAMERTGSFLRPWARRGHPRVGVLAAFVASGVGHEYFAFAVVGLSAYRPGYMFAFFALHGLAVMAQAAWAGRAGKPGRRMPVALAVPVHMAWITITVPLFVYPLEPVLHAFDGSVRALWMRLG